MSNEHQSPADDSNYETDRPPSDFSAKVAQADKILMALFRRSQAISGSMPETTELYARQPVVILTDDSIPQDGLRKSWQIVIGNNQEATMRLVRHGERDGNLYDLEVVDPEFETGYRPAFPDERQSIAVLFEAIATSDLQ